MNNYVKYSLLIIILVFIFMGIVPFNINKKDAAILNAPPKPSNVKNVLLNQYGSENDPKKVAIARKIIKEMLFDPSELRTIGDKGYIPEQIGNNYSRITTLIDRKNYGNLKSIIFYGPPGSGKTSLINQICFNNDMYMFKIDQSIFEGHSTDPLIAFKIIFDLAKLLNKKCAIFIDEVESVLGKRTEGSPNVQSFKISSLTTNFIQIYNNYNCDNVCFMGATNYLDRMEASLLDRSVKVYIPEMSEQMKNIIFDRTMDQHNVIKNFLLRTIFNPTNNEREIIDTFLRTRAGDLLNYDTDVARPYISPWNDLVVIHENYKKTKSMNYANAFRERYVKHMGGALTLSINLSLYDIFKQYFSKSELSTRYLEQKMIFINNNDDVTKVIKEMLSFGKRKKPKRKSKKH